MGINNDNQDNPTPDQDRSGSIFSPLSRPRISLHRFLFYFITLAVLVLIYLRFSEVKLIKDLFAKSSYGWLLAIVVVQLFSYYFLALNHRDVLRVKDTEVDAKKLFPVTFVIQFLNQALPSAGFSGEVFFIQYLKRFGITVAEGIGRAILGLATLYMAFGAFFIISVILMYQGGIIDRHPEARFFIYAFLFFAVIAFTWFFALQKRRHGRVARWMTDKFHRYFENRNKKMGANGTEDAKGSSNHTGHVAMIINQFKDTFNYSTLKRHGRAFWLAFFWQNMVMLANVVTLYLIAFAIGSKIGFAAAFITFTLTKFISMVSFIPGALGVFEGGMTLILVSFGVPAQSAFAMTLLLRAFTFWLPMPVGWILYRWYMHRQELEDPYSSA